MLARTTRQLCTSTPATLHLRLARRSMSSTPDCLFCKIVAGQIPCKKISESATTIAFLDIFPTSPGHSLIIPKYCAEKLHQLPAEQAADLGSELIKVAKAVMTATGCEDYNVLQNNGEAAHQVVKHVHFHVIPKPSAKQGLGVSWPSAKADDAVLDELQAKITAAMDGEE
eukprot:TRINITY_DN5379_c0_g1_i1.p2 TRINITY_DN5379_c0_g1~~TRINITY_DN5379_c0_g1_i1.p2  ORF type:complete len:170 (-),score=45.65 TRINITY_DN5379_c0_g1_i1:18-527(-)